MLKISFAQITLGFAESQHCCFGVGRLEPPVPAVLVEDMQHLLHFCLGFGKQDQVICVVQGASPGTTNFAAELRSFEPASQAVHEYRGLARRLWLSIAPSIKPFSTAYVSEDVPSMDTAEDRPSYMFLIVDQMSPMTPHCASLANRPSLNTVG